MSTNSHHTQTLTNVPKKPYTLSTSCEWFFVVEPGKIMSLLYKYDAPKGGCNLTLYGK